MTRTSILLTTLMVASVLASAALASENADVTLNFMNPRPFPRPSRVGNAVQGQ